MSSRPSLVSGEIEGYNEGCATDAAGAIPVLIHRFKNVVTGIWRWNSSNYLYWQRKSSLVLNVTLSWKITFRKFRKVLLPVFFLEKPKVELVVSVQNWDKEVESNPYLTHSVPRKYE